MVIDKRNQTEKIELTFEVEGGFTSEEIRKILEDIRIVVEQRPKTKNLIIIRL